MTQQPQHLRDPGELRDRAIYQLRQKRGRPLRYLLTGGILLAMWGFYGGGIFSLVIIMCLWASVVAIDAWNVYGRKPPSDEQIRREIERMT